MSPKFHVANFWFPEITGGSVSPGTVRFAGSLMTGVVLLTYAS